MSEDSMKYKMKYGASDIFIFSQRKIKLQYYICKMLSMQIRSKKSINTNNNNWTT